MIPHNQPSISKSDSNSLIKTLNSQWIAEGEEVLRFEEKFCDLFGLPSDYAVAVSSGSAALYLALMALNAKNKTVAIPSYSCASLENAVNLANAIPIYIDTSRNSFNMCQSNLEDVDIVIHPHMFGIPSVISKKINSKTIEDCAQSIGSMVDDQYVGLQGEIGIFSFYATKLMTTAGQGGMIISNDKKYIDYVRDFIHFDCKVDGLLRFNFQMTDLQASMGQVQLSDLFEKFLPRREVIFQKYKETGLPFVDSEDSLISPVRYRCLLRAKQPRKLINFLNSKKIKAIMPIEKKELLGANDLLVNSINHCNNLVSLPCYPSLSNRNLSLVIKSLEEGKFFI